MIQAKKHLGQNFLRNPDILRNIVGVDNLGEFNVIEVGPGPGDLTAEIIKRNPRSLTLIELDGDMIPLLDERFGKDAFHLIQSDVLKVNILPQSPVPLSRWEDVENKNGGLAMGVNVGNELGGLGSKNIILDKYRLYGNIPYYITSPIIHHFLYDVTLAPDVMILTMQKEVADRILARDKKHTVLSLACHLVADMTKICDINPNNFTPAPKVWSTCLRFDLKEGIERKKMRKVLQIVQLGFSQKRKKLISNLGARYDRENLLKTFAKLGIDENVRAEDLKIGDWCKIIEHLT